MREIIGCGANVLLGIGCDSRHENGAVDALQNAQRAIDMDGNRCLITEIVATRELWTCLIILVLIYLATLTIIPRMFS